MYGDHFVNTESVHLALAKVQGGLAVGSSSGQTFWVDSADPDSDDASGFGTYRQPFETIAYAVAQCKANRGDVVICKPFHVETVSTGVTLDVGAALVKVIGLGWGNLYRPTLQVTHVDGKFNLAGIGCVLENFLIRAAVANVTQLFSFGANGQTLRNCRLDATVSTYWSDIHIGLAARTDCLIENCNIFQYTSQAGSVSAIKLVGACPRTVIRNCTFMGDWSAAIFHAITAASTELTIRDCLVYNSNSVAAGIANLVAGCTGVLSNIHGWSGAANNNSVISPASCAACECYICNAAGESGGLAPATPSA